MKKVPPQAFSRSDRTKIAALLGAAVVTNVAYTILIPFVPVLEERFGMDALMIGAAFAGFSLTKSLIQPVGGVLVDRLRARPVAVAALFLGSLAIMGIAFADTGWQVIVLRLLWGFAEGVTVPALFRLCLAIRADSPQRQGRIMGWFGSAEVLGMAIGPALAGLLDGVLDFRGFFCLAAAITALGAAMIGWGLGPVDECASSAVEFTRVESRPAIAWSPLPIIVVFGLLDLVNNFVYAALEPALPLHVSASYRGIDSVQFVAVLFSLGLLVFSAVSLWTGRLLERFAPLSLLFGAFAIGALGLLVQGTATRPFVFAAGFLMFMLSQPLVYVAARTAIAGLPSKRRGTAFGYFGLISDIGWITGPLVGAALVHSWGGAVFVALAFLSMAAAVLASASLSLTSALYARTRGYVREV